VGSVSSSITSFCIGEKDEDTAVSCEFDDGLPVDEPVTCHKTSSLGGSGDWSTVSVLSIVGKALFTDGDGVKSCEITGCSTKSLCWLPALALASAPTVGAGSGNRNKKKVTGTYVL
jgi:hypothetical protein